MSKSRTDRFREPEQWYTWVGPASSSYPGLDHWNSTGIHSANANQDLLVSEGHAFHKLGRTHADLGGPFVVVRRKLSEVNSPIMRARTSTNPTIPIGADNYLGRFYAFREVVTDSAFAAPSLSSTAELNALGATAIARTIPTNPLAGLTTMLGELRSEGLPLLPGAATWRERTLRARNAGSEYLNVEFGWLPLLRDIQTLAHVVRNADALIKRYEKESGKLLHRSYTFPTKMSTSSTGPVADWPKPAAFTNIWVSRGVRDFVTTTKEETWFKGAFVYYLPPQGTLAHDAAVANKLLGTRITPEVVWNLTPWSWAVDWFTNMGDVIHNVSAFMNDGLVMPYAYIMRKRTTSREYTHTGGVVKNINYNRPLGTLQQTFTTEVKERWGASPFGFGLTFGGLSLRQKTILGALGLSRGSTGLKYR